MWANHVLSLSEFAWRLPRFLGGYTKKHSWSRSAFARLNSAIPTSIKPVLTGVKRGKMMMVMVHKGELHSGQDYSRGRGMVQVQFLLKLDFAP